MAVTEAPRISSTKSYVGRFAPSPSGPLHFGSLLAALGSWLQARSQRGAWLVRMEDIDPPREIPGAAEDILRTLADFGMRSDRPVLYQSQRASAYGQALSRLRRENFLFDCACTRSDLPADGIYPGTCRHGIADGRKARSIRVRATDGTVKFVDRVMGRQQQLLASEVGDFVVRRADGLTAYQLAVVVDDAFQEVTEVVRGADLLVSTGRQIYLQRLLSLATPCYRHLPLILGDDGRKLSKRVGADPVAAYPPAKALRLALIALAQAPPVELERAQPAAVLAWGLANWRPQQIPRGPIRLQDLAGC